MILEIQENVTYLDVSEKFTYEVSIADFRVDQNAIPKTIGDDKGDLIGFSGNDTPVRIPKGTDGQVVTYDSTAASGIAPKTLETGGGSATLTNRSGTNLGLGAVVIGDAANDKSFKTTTKASDPAVVGVLGAAINDLAAGKVLVGGQLAPILVQGNVDIGDWLVTSTTAGRAKSAGKQKPRYCVGLALTAYTGGGAGTVEAIVVVDTGNIAFLPTDIGGLQVWLDASQLTGLNNGDPVASYTDLSGNGRHFTQATAGFRPQYLVNILNGLPVVRFDGGDDRLLQTAYAPGAPHTIFIVAVVRTATSLRCLLSKSEDTGNPEPYIRNNAGTWQLGVILGASISDAAVQADVAVLFTLRAINGASTELLKNGTSQGTNANGLVWGGGMVLAADRGEGNPMNCDIPELIIYNSDLGATDRLAVEQYLMAKYGIV